MTIKPPLHADLTRRKIILMCKSLNLVILLTILWTFNNASAQSEGDISKQIWLDVNPAYYFNPDFKIFGDIGSRKEIENDGWSRLVLRPSIKTRIGEKSHFYAGIGNFYTFNETIADRWELRPFQGISFIWPHWKIPFHHYIRLEERFDYNTKTWQSKNSLRIRYQLTLSYKWAAIQRERFWQATASGEAFYTLLGEQGQFQEQARAGHSWA